MKKYNYLFLLIPTIILIIPLLAMQFTNQVNWGIMDFIVAGILLYGTAAVINIVIRKVKTSKYRIAISILILILFVATWAELAVGIFNTPIAGN